MSADLPSKPPTEPPTEPPTDLPGDLPGDLPAERLEALAALPTEEVPACVLHPATAGVGDPEVARKLALPAAYGVLACPRCGLRWLSPRPTAEGYETVYSHEAYFADRVGMEPYRDVVRRRLWGFRHRLRRLERRLGEDGSGDGSGLRILDVGAATGEFVVEARKRGHRAEGFEPSAGGRAEARERHGLELAGGTLEELSGRFAGPYDVVHLSHVLEHLPDPAAALATMRRLLAPGGVLSVEVPQQFDNDVEWLLRLLGRSRHGRFDTHSLHHTYFFTPPTLLALLAVAGFEVLELRTFHWGLTPPPSPRNLLLGTYLWLSDKVHRGGPVIEVHARPRGGGA